MVEEINEKFFYKQRRIREQRIINIQIIKKLKLEINKNFFQRIKRLNIRDIASR